MIDDEKPRVVGYAFYIGGKIHRLTTDETWKLLRDIVTALDLSLDTDDNETNENLN